MKYTPEFLKAKGLLMGHDVVPTRGDPERGMHMALYAKSFFDDLQEFSVYTQAVSSITQDWYLTGDIDAALEYYYPDDSGGSPIKSMSPVTGPLSSWLSSIDADIAKEDMRFNFDGSMWAVGDSEEFHVIGENSDYFFEAYLADCSM